MPGAGFKRKAKEWRIAVTACAEEPFKFVKEQIVRTLLLLTKDGAHGNYRGKAKKTYLLQHLLCKLWTSNKTIHLTKRLLGMHQLSFIQVRRILVFLCQ